MCLQFLAIKQLQPIVAVDHQQAVTAAHGAHERVILRAACLLDCQQVTPRVGWRDFRQAVDVVRAELGELVSNDRWVVAAGFDIPGQKTERLGTSISAVKVLNRLFDLGQVVRYTHAGGCVTGLNQGLAEKNAANQDDGQRADGDRHDDDRVPGPQRMLRCV